MNLRKNHIKDLKKMAKQYDGMLLHNSALCPFKFIKVVGNTIYLEVYCRYWTMEGYRKGFKEHTPQFSKFRTALRPPHCFMKPRVKLSLKYEGLI